MQTPVHADGGRERQTARTFHRDEFSHWGVLERILPVLEISQVQLRPGPPPSTATVFASAKAAAVSVHHHAQSVGVTVMKPEYFAYMCWAGTEDCRINGTLARRSMLHAQGERDGFHARGGSRHTMGIAVRRDDLVDTLASLRGVGPEDVTLNHSALELSPEDAARFQQRLVALLMNAARPTPGGPFHAPRSDPGEAIFGLLVDAELHAQRELIRADRARQPEQIVRRTEERFFAAQGAPVSLADLCAAARVSQATLYRAFHHVCGEPPLAYFHKRRLSRARMELLGSLPERGAVKRAALDAGLTELGRFSVEYRRLFGEPPSATLNRVVSL